MSLDSSDVRSRLHVRRRLAQIFTASALCIIAGFLSGLMFDGVADRIVKVWPPFTVIFPAIMVYLGHYTHVGSVETRTAMEKEE